MRVNEAFLRLKRDRATSVAAGLCSACSSHPYVLEAVVRHAARTGKAVLVEATANQVNQHGGYTGLDPRGFASGLRGLCAREGVDPSLVIFGGDHLGPYPWRGLRETDALREAQTLVRRFVSAGAQKIHLDASMPLGGDPGPALAPETAARRAVGLCAAAEDEWRRPGGVKRRVAPAYVIGTEVPVPGGETAGGGGRAPVPTRVDDFHETVDLHRRLFHEAGLDAAWERVIAVVVQPGVEFDSLTVFPYPRENAAALSRAIGSYPELCFECHSTDFQPTRALRAMVEDGFAILKVGPELTFTMREGLFGLASIEEELLGASGASRLREKVLEAMRSDPRHWKGFYPEDESLAFRMTYGYSDRMRYYWNRPTVAEAVRRLFENLGGAEIPPQLISQFLPHLGPMSDLPPDSRTPKDLVLASITATLERYTDACGSACP
jgi:D-tagatose-1,6-bisphosphate aldolase subunit GatZ/KbaZ